MAMHDHVPPVRPVETYSQGFWYAIIAAFLYLLSSMLLMVNMLGYFLGHYPQYFDLTDDQRNLILQTMMFFIWLGSFSAIFAHVEGWQYVDGLYFCQVTMLTIGFGDYKPMTTAGRGLVFLYSVFGFIILGLMVGSIQNFAGELSHAKIIRGHVERRRERRGLGVAGEVRRHSRSRNDLVWTTDPVGNPFVAKARTGQGQVRRQRLRVRNVRHGRAGGFRRA